MMRRIFIFGFFFIIFVAIVAYARGYRLDYQKKGVTSTGIIAVSSNPKAAKIYVNGELKGVTDTSLTLPPGKYTISVQKDGYTAWKRNLALKGELVMTADAMLFSVNSSLTPLTNLGVGKVMAIDQTGRMLLFSQTGNADKDGIYVFDQSKKPFSLFPPLKLLILKKNLPEGTDILDSTVVFSPDYKEGIFEFMKNEKVQVAYDMSFDTEVTSPFDVTTSMNSLIAAWEDERRQEAIKILEALPKDMRPVASDSFHIISFAPDKTKFLYNVTVPVKLPQILKPALISADQELETRDLAKGDLYIYDIKEDKNFKLNISQADFAVKDADWLPGIENFVLWYPDSTHLVLNELKQISTMEYDNTNRQVVYSGPHEERFLDVNSDGQLLVLANLNPLTNKSPDVYVVGIR